MLICIDPGHGGKDPGAVGKRGTQEKDINLAIAFKLGNHLKDLGHSVIYTRTNDIWLSLMDRVNISNKNNCNLLISVHCNSTTGGEGIESYNCPGSAKGKEYAIKVQAELIKATGLKDRGVKEAKFTVIYATKAPAILVESAFIDNPKEELLLMSEEYRDKVAKAIAYGITGKQIETPKPQTKVNYCLEFQKFYNSATKTGDPLKEDGVFGDKTNKAYETLGKLIRGEY